MPAPSPTANGSAVILPDGGVELTTGLHDQEGSAFDTTALTTTASFNLQFSYNLQQNDTSPQGDGFGFVIENAGPSAQGTSGGQVGFGGLPGQNIGILMRSWTNDVLQISKNSDISAGAALAAAAYPVGQLVAATGTEEISYNVNTNLLSVTATPTAGQGSPITLSVTIDLASLLGPTAWFGFTGATGTGDSIQTIDAASLQVGGQTITGFPGESTAHCFSAGTLILTVTGEKMVESLAPGDIVLTLSGKKLDAQPVKWIGRRQIDIISHPRPETVAPIRIRRDAIADNIPHSDLLVSPDHAILVDGKLICARQLINGTTIRQETDWASILYLHVELAKHSILLAEGMPAESYLNTGSNCFFSNSGEPLVLHPDLTNETDYPTREAASCEPFVWDEGNVRPVWERLAERAAALGQPVRMLDSTMDSGLRIVVKGRTLRALHIQNDLYTFALPQGAGDVRVVSRAGSATDVRPWLEDRRCLGVYVERIVLRHANDDVREIPIDHPALCQGWWAPEQVGTSLRRWTSGDALLPLPTFDGPAMLEIRASNCGMAYVINNEEQQALSR